MNTNTQPAKLLRLAQILPLYGTAKSQFHHDVAEGLMTSPVKPSRRLAFWPEGEIAAVNAARIAGRSHDELRALVRQLHAQRLANSPIVMREA